MKLANIANRPAIVKDGRALDIATASKGRIELHLGVLSDLSLHGELRNLADSAAETDWRHFDRRDLGRVSRPYKAIGVALNYRGHAEESNLPIPDEPSVFAKFASSVVGPYDPIVIPPAFDKVDYEAEVVIVMGATGRNISEHDAWSYVAGITAGQDISDRKEQWRKPINQFTLPKSYDTFSPIGPLPGDPRRVRGHRRHRGGRARRRPGGATRPDVGPDLLRSRADRLAVQTGHLRAR
jgi:2,4-diketo-3-deoxy-L-fuconate hydrolase